MASTDATVRALTDQAKSLQADDPNLLEKLQQIAEQVAAKQRELKLAAGVVVDDSAITDPADAFACEGCQ